MELDDGENDARVMPESGSVLGSTPLPTTAPIPEVVEDDTIETPEKTPQPCINDGNDSIAEGLQLLKPATERRGTPLIQEWREYTTLIS